MKTTFLLTTTAAVLAVETTSIGASEQWSGKMYLNVAAGAAVQQDVAIKSGTGGDGGKITFDTGVRADVAFGYHIFDSLAAELETGVVWNSIEKINGDAPSASSDLCQVPVLAKLIYTVPLKGALHPYLGVGAGGVASFADLNTPLASVKSSDFTFAYQAEAGLKYAVTKNIELGIAYKFMGTFDHNWSDNGAVFKTDGTMTHAILASFTWRF